ncbi:MAG: transcriptional regulator, partial [Myxococcota bacterium]|nr:transcriptional regulator [Myxococcota bacterium]
MAAKPRPKAPRPASAKARAKPVAVRRGAAARDGNDDRDAALKVAAKPAGKPVAAAKPVPAPPPPPAPPTT